MHTVRARVKPADPHFFVSFLHFNEESRRHSLNLLHSSWHLETWPLFCFMQSSTNLNKSSQPIPPASTRALALSLWTHSVQIGLSIFSYSPIASNYERENLPPYSAVWSFFSLNFCSLRSSNTKLREKRRIWAIMSSCRGARQAVVTRVRATVREAITTMKQHSARRIGRRQCRGPGCGLL